MVLGPLELLLQYMGEVFSVVETCETVTFGQDVKIMLVGDQCLFRIVDFFCQAFDLFLTLLEFVTDLVQLEEKVKF